VIALGARNVPQSALVDALWRGMDAERAQEAFDAALDGLRRLFGDGSMIVVREGRISLDPRQVCMRMRG
jgi:hypothetical protein